MVTQIAGGHPVCTEIENVLSVLTILSTQVRRLQGTKNISISRSLNSSFSIMQYKKFRGLFGRQTNWRIKILTLYSNSIVNYPIPKSTLSGRLSEPPMSSPVQLVSVGLCIQLSEIKMTFRIQLVEIISTASFPQESISVSLCWSSLTSPSLSTILILITIILT